MVWVTYEIFRKYIVTKRKKESGMEPVTVTIVGTEVYYGASDVMFMVLVTPERSLCIMVCIQRGV